MRQHELPPHLAQEGKAIAFTFRNNKDVDRFGRLALASISRLFPEINKEGADRANIFVCLTEISNNAKHNEHGKYPFPTKLTLSRKENRLILEMAENAPFPAPEVNPQTHLLNEHGRGLWLNHIICEASGGRLQVEGKKGRTYFEYVVGVPEHSLQSRILKISEREMPKAETIMAD